MRRNYMHVSFGHSDAIIKRYYDLLSHFRIDSNEIKQYTLIYFCNKYFHRG